MRLHQYSNKFSSALAYHIYDRPEHWVLWNNKFIPDPVKGLMQVFRQAIEIQKHTHQKFALGRDTGEAYLRKNYNVLIGSNFLYLSRDFNSVYQNLAI